MPLSPKGLRVCEGGQLEQYRVVRCGQPWSCSQHGLAGLKLVGLVSADS